jgi:O-antigen/teichoic acid export membrane protein
MSLYKNTSLILVGTLIANILAYVFNILVARKIGPESYGVLGALLALFSFASWIYMSLFSGITKRVAHLNADNKSNELNTFYFSAQREVTILLLAISLLVIFSSSMFSSYFNIPSISFVIITGILIWVNGMQYFYQSVLTGLKQYAQISQVRIIESVVRLLVVVLFLYLELGLIGVLFAYGLGYLIGYFWTRHKVTDKITTYFNGVFFINRMQLYSTGFKFFMLGLLYQIVFYGSSLYFQHNYSSTENGFWTAGLTISNIAFVFSSDVLQVVLPELSSEKNKQKRVEIIKKALLVIFLTTGSAALICWTIPEIVIQLFYGKSYLGATKFLKWQGVIILLLSLVQFVFTIQFSKEDKELEDIAAN